MNSPGVCSRPCWPCSCVFEVTFPLKRQHILIQDTFHFRTPCARRSREASRLPPFHTSDATHLVVASFGDCALESSCFVSCRYAFIFVICFSSGVVLCPAASRPLWLLPPDTDVPRLSGSPLLSVKVALSSLLIIHVMSVARILNFICGSVKPKVLKQTCLFLFPVFRLNRQSVMCIIGHTSMWLCPNQL